MAARRRPDANAPTAAAATNDANKNKHIHEHRADGAAAITSVQSNITNPQTLEVPLGNAFVISIYARPLECNKTRKVLLENLIMIFN